MGLKILNGVVPQIHRNEYDLKIPLDPLVVSQLLGTLHRDKEAFVAIAFS